MSVARRFIATIDRMAATGTFRRGALVLACAAALMAMHPFSASAEAQIQVLDAVLAKDDTSLKRLIASGAALETRDSSGRTALLIATRQNDVTAAKALIEAGADVNAKDNIHDTPYLYAAAEGRGEILELALANGANLKDTNRYGGTGLIPAADRGHVEIVRRLLATDIDIDHVNNLGWTALLEAVILGDGGQRHTEIVRLLVESGAKPIADKDGVTPLQHAQQRGFAKMASILEGKG